MAKINIKMRPGTVRSSSILFCCVFVFLFLLISVKPLMSKKAEISPVDAGWKSEWRVLVLNVYKDKGWEYIAAYDDAYDATSVAKFKLFLEKTFKGVAYTINENDISLLAKLTEMIFKHIAGKNQNVTFILDGDLLKFMIKLDLAERASRADIRYHASQIDTHFIAKIIPDIYLKILAEKNKFNISNTDLVIEQYIKFIVALYGEEIDKFFISLSENLKKTIGTEKCPLALRVKNMQKEKNKYFIFSEKQ